MIVVATILCSYERHVGHRGMPTPCPPRRRELEERACHFFSLLGEQKVPRETRRHFLRLKSHNGGSRYGRVGGDPNASSM